MVGLADATDVASGTSHVHDEFASTTRLTEQGWIDVGDAIPSSIDVPHVPHQRVVLNDRTHVFWQVHERGRTAEHFRDAPLGEVGRRRDEQGLLREGRMVAIGLHPREVKHCFRLPARHQMKNARIRPDEKLVQDFHDAMRSVRRFFGVDRDNVHGALRERGDGGTQQKRRVGGVEFGHRMGDVNDFRAGHAFADAALQHANVHAVMTVIAD